MILYASGKVENRNPENDVDEYILINALINNLLSSGKTLIEAIEVHLRVNSNYEEEFKRNEISKINSKIRR